MIVQRFGNRTSSRRDGFVEEKPRLSPGEMRESLRQIGLY
jgi:hypothetical protein